MARYIKANPKVAAFLGLTKDRCTVKDGNYLLWQADMQAFGPLTQLPETLAQIGGIALMPHEAKEEQDGTVTRPLPTAADPRFVVEVPAADDESADVPETTEPEDGAGAEDAETDATDNESGEVVETPNQEEESPTEGEKQGKETETETDSPDETENNENED